MKKLRRTISLIAVYALACWTCPARGASSIPDCPSPVGRVVSLQGRLELVRGTPERRLSVDRLDTPLCEGDALHTGPRGRAAVVLAPQTVVRIDQNATLRLKVVGNEVHVEMFSAAQPSSTTGSDSCCGAGYFITRFPRKFKVYTPFLNAAVEGTEFHVALAPDRSDLMVVEGRVSAQLVLPGSSVQVLRDRQQVAADAAQFLAPVQTVLQPEDAVQWALYYPPVSDPGPSGVPLNCADTDANARESCHLAHAEMALQAGRIPEAQSHIDALLHDAPDLPEGLALSAVIALVKNQKATALQLSERAITTGPKSGPAWLMRSYALQADFRLEDALEAAQRAAALTSQNALIKSHLAELSMSLGRMAQAELYARDALRTGPQFGRVHAIHGFVRLMALDIEQARTAFLQAIELDSTNPLPRLGLGLVMIRTGALRDGREQIEIAVGLDPANSLLRSYVGKAYFEENSRAHDDLAASQFDLAKRFDPMDPTPHYYHALLLRTLNRPADAADELRASIAKNNNRAIYRSEFRLDQDLAARDVSLATVHADQGFDQLSLNEATRSLQVSPDNFSAHRFLSDAYVSLPRHEIARASELLQAQLLQPLVARPVQPCLRDTDAYLANTSAIEPGYNEFTRLMEREDTRLYLTGLAGDHGRWQSEGLMAGMSGKVAYSFGACNYADGGHRTNQDYESEAVTGFVQVAATSWLDAQIEIGYQRKTFGAIENDFDPTAFSPNFENIRKRNNQRIGLQFKTSETSRILVSATRSVLSESLNDHAPDEFVLAVAGHHVAKQAEMAFLQTGASHNITIGGGAGRVSVNEINIVEIIPILTTIIDPIRRKEEHHEAYLYLNTQPWSTLDLTTGVSYQRLIDSPITANRYNPKLGLRWMPNPRITIRAAAMRTTKRFLTLNQTIEPTQLAGFNQFFDDFAGTRARRVGFGVDNRPVENFELGAEWSRRDLRVPVHLIDENTGESRDAFEPQRETVARGYAYWRISPRFTLAFDPSYDAFFRDSVSPGDTLVTKVDTVTLPLSGHVHFGNGMSSRLSLSRIRQTVDRLEAVRADNLVGTDTFILLDWSASYRLPRRTGVLSLEVRNLTNQRFNYRDDNFRRSEPVPVSLKPERNFWLTASITY